MYSSDIDISMEQTVDIDQLQTISENSRDVPNFWMYVRLVCFPGALLDDTSQAIKRRIGLRRSIAGRLAVIEACPKESRSAFGIFLKSSRISPSASHYLILRGELLPSQFGHLERCFRCASRIQDKTLIVDDSCRTRELSGTFLVSLLIS